MAPHPRSQNSRPQDTPRPPASRLRLRQPGTRKLGYAPVTPPIIYTPAPPPQAANTTETQPGATRDLSLQSYLRDVRGDLYRKKARSDTRTLLTSLVMDAAFKHTFWLRTAGFVWRRPALRYTLYPLVRTIYRHYQHKHCVWIPPATQIGAGLFLEHLSDIFINGRAVIGKNCNIANGVTVGQTNRGPRKGYPRIGDNVFIGPGAKILGAVTVGNNVAIGANCVVVRNVPDNAVVAAQPGAVISYKGSSGYVDNTDY